jgi:hypothetical protein
VVSLRLRYAERGSPLLEFDGIASGGNGNPYESLGNIEIAVVVDAYFGNDEAGLAIPDQAIANLIAGSDAEKILSARG